MNRHAGVEVSMQCRATGTPTQREGLGTPQEGLEGQFFACPRLEPSSWEGRAMLSPFPKVWVFKQSVTERPLPLSISKHCIDINYLI